MQWAEVIPFQPFKQQAVWDLEYFLYRYRFPRVLILEQLILKLIAPHVREKPVSAASEPSAATTKKGQHFLLTQKKSSKRKPKQKLRQLERQRQAKAGISSFVVATNFEMPHNSW